MEMGSFLTEDRVALERMICSVMEASVVETVLVAEKCVIWLLLEMGMLLKDMDALQEGASINEKVVSTMVGRVKPEVEPENKDYDYDDDDYDDYDYDDGYDYDDDEEDEDDGGDQDDGSEDDLSGDEDSEGDDDDDDDDDPDANGEGGSEEEEDDDGDDDEEDNDDGEDEDEDEEEEEETPQPPSVNKMAKGKYYVVFEGDIPGIYDSWEDCAPHVLGYPGNIHKSYSTREEAVSAFNRYQRNEFPSNSEQVQVVHTIPIVIESAEVGSTSMNPEIKKANSLEQEETSVGITKKLESDENSNLVIHISDLTLV